MGKTGEETPSTAIGHVYSEVRLATSSRTVGLFLSTTSSCSCFRNWEFLVF